MANFTPRIERIRKGYSGVSGRGCGVITWQVYGYDGENTGDILTKKRAAVALLSYIESNPGIGTWQAFEQVRDKFYAENNPNADDFG